jgi:hypothetical protein
VAGNARRDSPRAGEDGRQAGAQACGTIFLSEGQELGPELGFGFLIPLWRWGGADGDGDTDLKEEVFLTRG